MNNSMTQADTSSAAEPVPSPPTIEEAVSRFCLGQEELMVRLARIGEDNPEPSIGGHQMDRNDVAAMLARNPSSKSVDRAMRIVAQGYDLVAVRAGGKDEDLERARREFPHASYIAVLARGYTRLDDRIGVFVEKGIEAPMLF